MSKKALLLLFTLLPTVLSAQGGFRSTYDSFMLGARAEYNDNSKNLREVWDKFKLSEGLVRVQKPKRDSLQWVEDDNRQTGKQLRVSEVKRIVEYQWPETTDTGFRWRSRGSDTTQFRCIVFDFYGESQEILIPARLGSFHPKGISEGEVADFWQELSRLDLSRIISEVEIRRSYLGYNDWAILEWVQSLSHAVFPKEKHSECVVFSVYLLNQVGLMTRMARVQDRLILLFAAIQPVFGRKYVVLDTYPFYLADSDLKEEEVFTYANESVWKTRPLDLRLKHFPFPGTDSYRSIQKRSTIFGRTMILPINMAAMSFYSRYPQLEAREYILAQQDPLFLDALSAEITPVIAVMEDIASINMVLSFLQKDFDYKVDVEQFGNEKPFFPEENFIYAFNDCEDRSILFSFLAKHLLHKKVVLLEYEDHIASAILLNENLKGDYVKIGAERYYVCDPSFMNAKVGMTIPEYRNRPAKVWILE